MKPNRPNNLGKCIVRFFQEYLPTLRGMRLHTIRSYRDAVVLFLRFTANHCHRGVEDLDIDDFTAEQVSKFLTSLEMERHNGIATRNARLAALHTLVRFLASEQPEHLAELQRILGIPFKRGTRNAPIEYFESDEVEALLNSIDRSTGLGQRDYALFALMFNTGARVQEVLDLRVRDVRIDPPSQVRLSGKGGKVRVCPIWAHTAALLRELSQQSPQSSEAEAFLFTNHHGAQLTRFGVRYLLKKYVAASIPVVSTLQGKQLHPHSLRHTTAVHLLKAGVDFATISQWLGHSSLNTTMVYARADLDIKRQALAQVFPEVFVQPRAGGLSLAALDVVDWLKRL
jgi:site-specific recombinase XerD